MTKQNFTFEFRKYKVILFFLLPFFFTIFMVWGIINQVILAAIPFILFLLPGLIWTINFAHLFNKKPPLIFTDRVIFYNVLNLELKYDDIQRIEILPGKSNMLIIRLSNFEPYKKQLGKSIFGKLMLLNFRSMEKNLIFINVSVLKKEKDLHKALRQLLPNNKLLLL